MLRCFCLLIAKVFVLVDAEKMRALRIVFSSALIRFGECGVEPAVAGANTSPDSSEMRCQSTDARKRRWRRIRGPARSSRRSQLAIRFERVAAGEFRVLGCGVIRACGSAWKYDLRGPDKRRTAALGAIKAKACESAKGNRADESYAMPIRSHYRFLPKRRPSNCSVLSTARSNQRRYHHVCPTADARFGGGVTRNDSHL